MKVRMLFPLLAAILVSCTSNPFSDNEISQTPNTVTGTVLLENGGAIDDAYLWLQGFGLGVRTDEAGQFTLTIPSASQTGTDVDGVFELFAYVANCHVVTRPLVVRNSEFVFSQDGLTSKGNLTPDIQLTPFLKIRTDATVRDVDGDPAAFYLSTKVSLQTTGETVSVSFPTSVGAVSGPLLIRHIESGEVKIVSTIIVGIAEANPEVTAAAHIRSMQATFKRSDFKPGRHEVIPFLLLNTEAPAQLIASLGPGAQKLGPDYLSYPFVREGGIIDLPETVGSGD